MSIFYTRYHLHNISIFYYTHTIGMLLEKFNNLHYHSQPDIAVTSVDIFGRFLTDFAGPRDPLEPGDLCGLAHCQQVFSPP